MSNLREEINCFERIGLNGLCPNTNILPFIESKAIEGERRSTYWCMSVILNSLFFFSSRYYFLLFFSFSFFLLTFLPNAYFWLWFFLEIPITVIFSNPPSQCTARGPLYKACRDWYLQFWPLTAFVWCKCHC